MQALSVLQREHLVEYRSRMGYCVCKISRKEYNDLIDVRIALECLAVETVIKNMDAVLEKSLLEFLKDFKIFSKINDSKKYYNVDKKFHNFLIETSKNYYLKHIYYSFNILLLTYLKGFMTEIVLSMEIHKKIIEAIINRDTLTAAKLIREHIEGKKKSYIVS